MRPSRRSTAFASLSFVLVARGLMVLANAQTSAPAATSIHLSSNAWAGNYTSTQTYTPKGNAPTGAPPKGSKDDRVNSFTVHYRIEINGVSSVQPSSSTPEVTLKMVRSQAASKKKSDPGNDDSMRCDVRVRNRTQLELFFSSYPEGAEKNSLYKKGDLLMILHRAETGGRIEYTATPGRVRFEDKHWIVLAKE